MADLAVDGYTVLEGAIEASLVAELQDALGKLEADLVPADNDFEGRNTLERTTCSQKVPSGRKFHCPQTFCP